MILYIDKHEFLYEMEALCRIFFPCYKIKTFKGSVKDELKNEDIIVYTGLTENIDDVTLSVWVNYYGRKKEKLLTVKRLCEDFTKSCELAFAKALFEILVEFTGIRPEWGILTGVRPIKLARRVLSEEGSQEKAKEYFIKELFVTERKTDFAFRVMKTEQEKILSLSKRNSFSLYVSIPFCPSRCSYCSFVSQSIEKYQKLLPQYFELLLKELEYTSQIVKELKLRLETVYIGGGTPTVLDAQSLETLISKIKSCFDMSNVREFTVEAGRPDTITEEKLRAIKNSLDDSISRISINPQTMNDEVLQAIGRKHTASQTLEAFCLAKKVGIKNINADLIVGLPKDTLESFQNSLNSIATLEPTNITVHTLAMKRASYLSQSDCEEYFKSCKTAKAMLDFAYERLEGLGYIPYYSYRQSKMVGNLENTGFSKPGYEGLYNAYIMDETHTILACGASAVSKLQCYKENYLERIFNFKLPYEYIKRFDEILDRKKGVKVFYDKYFGNF